MQFVYPKLFDWLITLFLAGLLLCPTCTAHGSERQTTEQEEAVQQGAGALDATGSRQIGQAPDDISRKLDVLEKPKQSLIDRAVIEPLVNRWDSVTDRLREKIGLDIAVAYTTLYQRLTDKKDGKDPREGAVGDLDIFGEWTLPGSEVQRSWRVGYQAETPCGQKTHPYRDINTLTYSVPITVLLCTASN